MKIYDISHLRAQYVKPDTNLSIWASLNKPYALCNASLYGGVSTVHRPTGDPVGTIFEDGSTAPVHNDGNGYGFGIVDGKIVFGKPWDRSWKYYITGYTTCVLNGEYVAPSFNDSYVFPNRLARIAIGKMKDGRVVIITDDNATLKEFAEHAIAHGVDILCNLDGGGSRHLVYDYKTIYQSARVPYNAFAFYQESSSSEDGSAQSTNTQTSEGSSMRKYLDVSAHQGVIDWDKVKKEGNVQGVMIRAGYGKNNLDAQFARNASECNRVGIPCGAYWFSYATTANEAANEASYLLAAVRPYRMELPMAYDFEYDSVDNAAKRGVTITKSLASSFVTAFCGAIEKAGYWALNYANPDYLSRYFDSNVTSRYGLWLAQWPNKVDVTKPPRKCAIWQWGTSMVPGIAVIVDTNEAYTDFATLIKQYKMNNLMETQTATSTPTENVAQPQTSQDAGNTSNSQEKQWYEDAMQFVADQGWMTDDRPNDPLTRAEFATVLQRIYKK